jgi:hypothetical protein
VSISTSSLLPLLAAPSSSSSTLLPSYSVSSSLSSPASRLPSDLTLLFKSALSSNGSQPHVNSLYYGSSSSPSSLSYLLDTPQDVNNNFQKNKKAFWQKGDQNFSSRFSDFNYASNRSNNSTKVNPQSFSPNISSEKKRRLHSDNEKSKTDNDNFVSTYVPHK